MSALSGREVKDIVGMGKEIQDCIYAKTGEVGSFELVDAQRGQYQMTSDNEMKDAIADCIRDDLPTMRGKTRRFYENILNSLNNRDPDE